MSTSTRRPRAESEVMNEDNKKLKTLWRFQKLYYVVLIIYAITLIIGMLLIKSNEILSVIIMVIGFIITPILYFVASFRYHKCPYCYHLFNVRKLYDEEFCPYCGKRIKPIKSQLKK